MGLFDFLSPPKKNSKHHYAFAHYALRFIAFAEPVPIFGILASKARVNFCDDILRDLDTRVEDTERRNFSGKDLGFTGFTIGERPCAVIQMPPTTNPTEAYFIAIVGRLPLKQLSLFHERNSDEVLIDYYTLERPVQISPERQSVFCAWTRDAHLNYGKGPQPTLEKFCSFLTSRVQSEETKS